MRLSLSLQLDVLKAKAGSILNTFKIHPRRDVLFFEDILAQYIRECEKAGYEKEIGEIGKKWSALETNFVPQYMRTLAAESIANRVIKHVWTNLGLLDDFNVSRTGAKYVALTKNEFITRRIGENNFMRELFTGFSVGFHKHDARCREYLQTRESCRYVIELLDEPFQLATKEMEKYVLVNSASGGEGFSLKKALLSGFFQIEGNQVKFRGKTMLCIENSGFHLFGRSGIFLDHLSSITASFFEGLVEKTSDQKSKILLLKNILQSCGWGCITVETTEDGRITFLIAHPPYGLQAEEDNWAFLANFILGYLRLVSDKIVLKETALRNGVLSLRYSKL